MSAIKKLVITEKYHRKRLNHILPPKNRGFSQIGKFIYNDAHIEIGDNRKISSYMVFIIVYYIRNKSIWIILNY